MVAIEKHRGRAHELAQNVERLGARNVRVVNADALDLPDDLGAFDRVLVDAPCSGLGVLASRPDLRWRAKPLPELQLELLRAAVPLVRPGGTLTYSVCTIHEAENQAVVDALGLSFDDLGRRVARFPPSAAARVPAHAAAPARNLRVLRRPPANVGSIRGLA